MGAAGSDYLAVGRDMKERAYSQKDLLDKFAKASQWYKPNLILRYGPEPGTALVRQAQREYEELMPDIPFIGGPGVHMTEDLLESAQVLAYLRVLKRQGKTLDESWEIVSSALKTRVAEYPRLVIKLAGLRAFSSFYVRSLQRQAFESHKRKYPGGFVFDIVLGNGQAFDWGLDFTECGICKFYQAQSATEFLPMVCSLDYILSDALGYGLARTQTLAEGAERCNPRLKKGRAT